MSIETTPVLGLPLLHAAQAQKEITHNEALCLVDALLAGVISGEPSNTAPTAPDDGTLWVTGPAPTGLWTGRADQLALWTANGWRFVDPPQGARFALEDGRPITRTESGWESGIIEADSIRLADHVRVGDHRVVGPRQAAIAPPAGGAMVDSEGRAAIGSILDALTGHGLIG